MALLAVRRMLQAIHAALMRVEPREDAGPAWAARGDGGIRLGEADARAREPVDVGRLDDAIAIAAELHAEVIGNDEDDIFRFALSSSAGWGEPNANEEEQEEESSHGRDSFASTVIVTPTM